MSNGTHQRGGIPGCKHSLHQRRQLSRQRQQQQQQDAYRSISADLPDKQNQSRHNPVSESWQRGTFTSDQ